MELKGYVSLAYAIIGQAERDARNYEKAKKNKKYYITDFNYKTAKNFATTQLYDICETLIAEWHRVYDAPKCKIVEVQKSV